MIRYEKNIEEIARTLCGEKEQSCAECESCPRCEFWIESSVLHKAGYRKQIEVAREIFAEINLRLFLNMNERHYEGDRLVEMNFSSSLEDDIAALEKKYTEGEHNERK